MIPGAAARLAQVINDGHLAANMTSVYSEQQCGPNGFAGVVIPPGGLNLYNPPPTAMPTSQPSHSQHPTSFPSSQPSNFPSVQPSSFPSSSQPSAQQSCEPSSHPSMQVEYTRSTHPCNVFSRYTLAIDPFFIISTSFQYILLLKIKLNTPSHTPLSTLYHLT